MLNSKEKQKDLILITEVSCIPLQQSVRYLQTAVTNFFSGHTTYPNFKKKKRNSGSVELIKSDFKWENSQVYLAKCSEPRLIKWSIKLLLGCIPTKIKVKLTSKSRWFVSLRVNNTRDLILKPLTKQ